MPAARPNLDRVPARARAVDRSRPPAAPTRRSTARRRRRAVGVFVALVAAAVGVIVWSAGRQPDLPPLRARIVAVAEGQVGYTTDPANSYCNRFSAYWQSGTPDCGNSNYREEWCADFAAWVWKQAGAEVVYQFINGDLNSSSASFYEWGAAHGTWHPIGSRYVPQPGDVAVYGLDPATLTAAHVAVVTGYTAGQRGPDVVNGDGDRTGYSVVETGTDQYRADAQGGAALSGYVAPTAAPSASTSSG
ncbi:MAG: CHAP domain-containing protein [Acidimicrobiales bacterium]